MKKAIGYHNKLLPEAMSGSGFLHVELPYELREQIPEHLQLSGVKLNLKDADGTTLAAAVSCAEEKCAEYIVIDTRNVCEEGVLFQLLDGKMDLIRESGLAVYIENGFCEDSRGNYRYNPFSEISDLKRMVDQLNGKCGCNCFAICFNMGYANVLAKNLRAMVEEGGSAIGLVHMNDNDGFHNEKQIPYTFTTGRGGKGTDIYHVIGMLIKNQYDGWMVFDVDGMINRTPMRLQSSYLKLIAKLYEAWEREFCFEKQVLDQPDKALILFGAGNMARDFLRTWGHKYWPEFLVDNDQDLWGQMRWDIEIKSPEELLQIPPEYRNVIVCNMCYDEIGEQLDRMGVAYECFWDQYYI